MMSLATPVVLGFLGKRARDKGMSLSDFTTAPAALNRR